MLHKIQKIDPLEKWPSQRIGMILFGIILLGLLLRLPFMNVPLLDRNSWRQTDTAAIARNFHEHELNIFYPQVDWRGASEGYIESEFPIYPFLIAILYRVFGLHDLLGRMVSLLFFIFSAVLLFHLTQKLLDDKTAIWATLFFMISPMNIHFSRTFMPTSMLVCCSIASIYYFSEWIDKEKWSFFFASALSTTLAVLIKPTSLHLGLPLLYLALRKYKISTFSQWRIGLFALLVLMPSFAWYYHARQLFLETHLTFGIWAGGYSKFGNPTYWLNPSFYKVIVLRIVNHILTLPGLVLATIGFFLRVEKRNYVAFWWGLAFAIDIFIVAEGHQTHDYYQMPLVPVLSIYAGQGMNYLWGKDLLKDSFLSHMLTTKSVLVILFILMSIAGLLQTREYLQFDPKRLEFGQRIEQLTEADSLVIIGGWRKGSQLQVEYPPCDPIDFYISHRKGWEISLDQWSVSMVDSLREQGARYFASYYPKGLEIKEAFAQGMRQKYSLLEATDRWFIYSLGR